MRVTTKTSQPTPCSWWFTLQRYVFVLGLPPCRHTDAKFQFRSFRHADFVPRSSRRLSKKCVGISGINKAPSRWSVSGYRLRNQSLSHDNMQYKNVIAALALASVGGVDAFFRINCAKIQVGRVDPIVNPGALAAHCHTISGGSSKCRL
jgi:hypothetical protein